MDGAPIILAREQAQAASKAKSEFLANITYEIRTPLNGVIGFTDLLKNTHLTKLQQQYLENANTSAHMLLGIISDILDLSKIESGKLELDPSKTDIIELTAQAIDIVKYKASEKGIALNMGFTRMSDLALRAEELGVSDLEKLSALRDEMRKELSLIKIIVKKYA